MNRTLDEHFEQWYAQLLKLGPGKQAARNAVAEARKGTDVRADIAMKRASDWLAEFERAGGQYIYVLVDNSSVVGGYSWTQGVLVVPLGQHADEGKLVELLDEVQGRDMAHRIGNALVVAPLDQRTAILRRRERRDEDGGAGVRQRGLTEAFAAAGDVPARFAIAPGDAARRFLDGQRERFGTDALTISRGLRWVAVGISQESPGRINVTVRAVDASAAHDLMDMIARGPPDMRIQLNPPWRRIREHLQAHRPTLRGEVIRFNLDLAALLAGVVRTGQPDAAERQRAARAAAAEARQRRAAEAKAAVDRMNVEADELEAKAVSAVKTKRFGEAIELYERHVAKYPRARRSAAVAKRLAGMRTNAATQTAVKNERADAECRQWLNMAGNYARAGRPDKARQLLQRVIDRHPKTPWAAAARERLDELD